MTKDDLKQIAELLDDRLEKALDTQLEKVLDDRLEKALDTQLEKVLDDRLEKALDTQLEKVLDDRLEKALDTQLEKVLDDRLEKALDTQLEKALDNRLDKVLDDKFEKAFAKNNKILKDEIISEMGEIVNTAFSEFETKVNYRFDKVEEELSKRPSRADVQKWADENLIPNKIDVAKLKFLHIKELKDLPDNLTINSALIEEGLV